MTHPTPGGAGLRIAPAMPSSTPLSQRYLDRNILRHGIAARRHRLAELETSMVEACERSAVRGACRNVRIDDCKTWDKATWQRYLEGRRATRTGLPASDAQIAPGHRQNSSGCSLCQWQPSLLHDRTDHGHLPEEYWIRQITDRAIMRHGSMTRFQ